MLSIDVESRGCVLTCVACHLALECDSTSREKWRAVVRRPLQASDPNALAPMVHPS